MFTETERTILNALPPKYKYIYRSPNGELRICERTDRTVRYLAIFEFNHLFKDVKAGTEPICFRRPILDDTEREYLKAVFKPFHREIYMVRKMQINRGSEYILVMTESDNMIFPEFKYGAMYRGMKPNKNYSLEELGITYD